MTRDWDAVERGWEGAKRRADLASLGKISISLSIGSKKKGGGILRRGGTPRLRKEKITIRQNL